MLEELHKGFRSFLKSALDFNASFDGYDLEIAKQQPALSEPSIETTAPTESYNEVVNKYLDEGKRGNLCSEPRATVIPFFLYLHRSLPCLSRKLVTFLCSDL